MERKIKISVLDLFSLQHPSGNVREANWSSGERLGWCYKFTSHQHADVFKATTLDEEMMETEKIRNPSKD